MKKIMKNKKLRFSFDKSALDELNISIDEGRELIYAPFEAARLFDYVTLLTNIKSGDYLPIVDFNPSFVAGGCGYSDGNQVGLTSETITTKLLKSDLTLCPNDLVGTAFERYLPEGANVEDFEFSDALRTYLIANYARAIQNMCLTGTAGENSIDGLVTRIYAATDVNVVEGTAPSADDALTKLFAIYQAMPGVVLSSDKRPVILVGNDWLKMAVIQAFNDNRYFGNIAIDADNGFILPATNVRVQGFEVLDGTNQAIAGAGSLMFVGTDLEDDMSTLRYWWSEDNQEIRSVIQFRIGTQVVRTNLFARYEVSSGSGS
jgi:hypothetical protein